MGEPSSNALETWLAKPNAETLVDLSGEDSGKALSALIDQNPAVAIRVLREVAKNKQWSSVLSGLSKEPLLKALVLVLQEEKKGKPRLTWWHLRPIGSFPLLKFSYLALLALPLISKFALFFGAQGYLRFFAALYFGSLSLALGNLIFDIFCPAIIKRFASPNDLYVHMLDVALKQQQCYPQDAWVGNLRHSRDAYNRESLSAPGLRYLSFTLYGFGALLFAYVFYERSALVLESLCGTQSPPWFCRWLLLLAPQ